MSDDTEQLVISISADTTQINRAINRLLGTVNSSTRGIETAFTRTGAAMDGVGTSATKLQQQINALTGVNTSMKSRADDIAAYGAQLDAVRAKYNPLFAAQQQYKQSLADINSAAKAGALNEKEHAVALAKTKAAFADQVKSLKGVNSGNTELAKSGKLATYELVNLSRQVQDVGVQLVGGQGLFTIIAQQGPQIADIFTSSKTATVGGAFKQIGGGIASVITPMRLLGVTTAATGAIALASLASWKSYTLQLDDTARTVGTTAADLSKLQAAASFKGISPDEFTKGIADFGKGVYDAKNNMGGLAEVFRANNVHATEFGDALSKAADIIKNARDDQQRLVLLQQMGLPATMQWVRYLQGGSEGLKAAKDAAVDFGGAVNDNMIKKARDFDEAWNRTTTNFSLGWRSATITVGGWLKDLVDKAPKIGAFEYKPSAQVKNALLLSGQGSTLAADTNVDRFYSGLGSSAPGNGANKGSIDKDALKNQISQGQQYLALLGQTTTASEARRQVELQLQAAALTGVTIDSKRAEILKKLAEENLLGITAIKQQADSYRVEANTVGLSVGQATAYVAAQNALNDARRNGRALTEENIAAINKEAAALGAAAQAAANAQIAQQIAFGRKTMFLSSDDVQIASTLAAKYGNDIPAALMSSDAAAIRVNKTFSDIAQSMQSGLVTGLADIADGTKSVSQGFADLGKSILRMLEEAAIKAAIVKPLFAGLGLGGGGSGLLSLIPHFASGTNFAPGGLSLVGERGPELVNLPRGSQVVPNHRLSGDGGGSTQISYTIDARGADSGTVERIQKVLDAHARAIAGQGRAMQSAQRYQSTGVG